MLPAGVTRYGYWAGGCCGYEGGGCCAKGCDAVLGWIVPVDLSSTCWLLEVWIWLLLCFIITMPAIEQIVTTIITKIKLPITLPTTGPIMLDANNGRKEYRQSINHHYVNNK